MKKILAELALQNQEISILLLDDPQITDLNKKYLNRNFPTDVLSFPMSDNHFPGIHSFLLGDVVISVETANRQASKKNCTLYEEITWLLIHGILHLIGYDHESSSTERKKMKQKEKGLFQKVI